MATARTVDFTSVQDGGGFNKHRVPEGDYLATIVKCEDAKSKSDDVFQYLFTIKLNKHTGYAYPYYCKLQENQLWKLRNLAIAAGLNVPKKRIKFDPSKVIGKTIGVTMEDDEYEGKLQSNIAALFPSAELMDGNVATPADDDEDIADDEPDEDIEDDVEEDEDEDTTDEFDAMDRAQLKAALKAQDASFVAKKSQTDDDLRDLLRESGDEEEEDEEDEPEPTPPPRRAKAATKAPVKAAAKKPARKAAEVTDEELEELDIDDI
jgi:hypothetical protein